MPVAPALPTTITAGVTAGHAAASQTAHAILNSIYLANIGATRTAAATVTQSMSGEVIPVNVSSSVAITVPSLVAGTNVEFVQTGTAGFTLTASGVTFVPAAGTPRQQGSSVGLLWLTATSVLVSGDLA